MSLRSFVTSFKKISLKFDFIHFFFFFFFFFYDFIHVYSLGAGTRGQSSDVNRNVSSLYSFVASLKKKSLKFDLCNILNDLIHVCSPIKAGADSNQGTKF